MILTAELATWSLSKRQTLQVLRKFVYETQWQKIDKSILEGSGDDVEGKNGREVLALIREVMESCDGALDIFGPPELLHADIVKYHDPVMSDGFNYVDSMLRTYMTKTEIFYHIDQTTIERAVKAPDPILHRILMETFETRVRNQLAGTFEIVPASACTDMDIAVMECLAKKVPIDKLKKGNWNRKTPEEVFQEIQKFLKVPKDSANWIRLRNHINSSKRVTYEIFSQLQNLHHLLNTLVTNNKYVFDTFQSAEKKPSGKKYDTFIRLFHDGNKKFLFRKDVESELEKALTRKYKGKLDVPKGILKSETPSDMDVGRFFIISYSKYLETIDQLKLSRDDITLVNVEVKRTRHLAVPIITPYGTECKPVIDVFYEILSILTIELQAWQRIPNQKIQPMLDMILISFVTLLDPRTPEHLISTEVTEIIGSKLRNDVGRLLEGPIQKVEAFKESKPLTWYLLYEEVIENWKLERIFPDIRRSVNTVFTKHVDFEKSKLVSQLELTMMVQECISLSFLKRVPGMLHCLSLCHLARDTFCEGCIFPCRRPVIPKQQAVVQLESEFHLQFAQFPIDNLVYASLLGKTDSKMLITNSMVRSFIFQNILQHPAASSISSALKVIHAKELINKWKKPEDISEFYMTVEESIMLGQDIENKFFATCEQEIEQIFKDAGGHPVDQLPVVQKRIVQEYTFGLEDWMKYMNRRVRSQTSFAEFAPDRDFYIKYIQLFPVGSVKKELYVNFGEFLEVVKILLDQRQVLVSKEELDLFEELTKDWMSASGWVHVRMEEIQKTLMLFSVDTTRIRFVPEIRSFFRGIVKRDLKDVPVPVDQKKPTTSEAVEYMRTLKAAYTNLLLEKQELQKRNGLLAEDLKKEKQLLEAAGKEHAEKQKQNQKQNDGLTRMLELARRDMDKMRADLKRITVEHEQMERELASRPETFQDDPIVKNLIVEKDQKIRNLRIDNSDKDHKIKVLESKWGRSKRDKETVERQLADATSKIRELELEKAQKTDSAIAGENQRLLSKLRLEQIKQESLERQNADLLKHIEELENKLAVLASASLDPPASECGICFMNMGKKAKTTKCGTCKTVWHAACITKWTATNPTCPMCRSAFPAKAKN